MQKKYSLLTNALDMGDNVMNVCPSVQWSLILQKEPHKCLLLTFCRFRWFIKHQQFLGFVSALHI